jgi:hypothetical protein
MNSLPWISVKDKLPEKSGEYIVKNTYKIQIKSFHNGNFYKTRKAFNFRSKEENDLWLKDAKTYKTITHWMELPKIPENT